MHRIKRKYWGFYMEGRADRRLRTKQPIDVEVIAKQLLELEDANIHDVLRTSVEAIAADSFTPRIKKAWLADHEQPLKEAECDGEEAYGAWCAGRVDELVYANERDVVDAIANQVFEDE